MSNALMNPTDSANVAGVPPAPPEGSPKSRSQLLDTAAALRAYWTEQGVPQEKQDELIAAIAAQAAPGAQVGPFAVPQEG